MLKFGGSSVANATAISGVLDIVEGVAREDRVILVCSAISGCTDSLISGDKKALESIRRRHLDIISRLFTGEDRADAAAEFLSLFDRMTKAPAAEAPAFGEVFSTRILARKLSCEGYSTAWADSRELVVKGDEARTTDNIRAFLKANAAAQMVVAPGFIARGADGKVCTLGRGGSDYSAAIFAAAAKASSFQIWTDVPGIMTCNPKIVPTATTISKLSYDSALKMAEHGAKVLYAPTIAPALAAGIEINIRDTFQPSDPGTVIGNAPGPDVCAWTGVSNLPSENGNQRVFLSFEGPAAPDAVIARISACLKAAGIAPLQTGTEKDGLVWAEVRDAVLTQACRAIHREFFEIQAAKTLDLYIAGNGAVGNALRKLVESGAARKSGRHIRIAEISSSRDFAQRVLQTAPRHSVFADCTDSEDIHAFYVPLLEAGINIVSSNRRSLAVPFVEYAAMKQAALQSGCFFRYSTTVGTALPVLESILAGAMAGDEPESIEAVVSCTLNRILSEHESHTGDSFATLLRKAQEEGLTEKDPRFDLGGEDALKKLLILAREAGIPLEREDVKVIPAFSQRLFDCSLDEFYKMVESREQDLAGVEADLQAKGFRQRFIASVRKDSGSPGGFVAEIKLVPVPSDSPFYRITGTENVIEIRRKFTAPMVIRGAGEGAGVAACGVLNDILK